MAHLKQLTFIKILSNEVYKYTDFLNILEIGSYDVNGSIRPFFDKSCYVGVDLIQGKGVDVVCDGHLLEYEEESFDMVISCESFEHNPYWKETFINMVRMTKNGGLVVFTCATTGRAEHGTTRTSSIDSPGTIQMDWDYYQNLIKEDFAKIPDFKKNFKKFIFLENKKTKDLYFIGIKKGQEKFDINFKRLRLNYLYFQFSEWLKESYMKLLSKYHKVKNIFKLK